MLRTSPLSQIPMPKTVPTKPYDWTYTTLYPGHLEPTSSEAIGWKSAERNNPNHTIPLAELTRHDPILFYAEIPLYEDELHDNGASHLLVRIVCEGCSGTCCSSNPPHPAGDAYLHIHIAAIHSSRG